MKLFKSSNYNRLQKTSTVIGYYQQSYTPSNTNTQYQYQQVIEFNFKKILSYRSWCVTVDLYIILLLYLFYPPKLQIDDLCTATAMICDHLENIFGTKSNGISFSK